MTLKEVIQIVKDENLSKEQLEQYFDMVSALLAQLLMDMSELEKKEALFMLSEAQNGSVASVKVKWRGSTEGQKLIGLKRYAEACKVLLRSIKNKIFSKL